MYNDSEVLLGKWYAVRLGMRYSPDTTPRYRFKKTSRRNEIFLATKFGLTGDPARPVNGEPEYAKRCLETSLDRLQGA